MKSSDLLLNLPDLKQAFNPCPIVVAPDTPLLEVLGLMQNLRLCEENNYTEKLAQQVKNFAENEAANIVDLSVAPNYVLVTERSRILGIFTEQDFVRVAASSHPIDPQTKIAELMTQPIVSLKLTNSANIFTPLLFFRQYQIRHLPIVDDRKHLLGIITPANIIQALQFTNLFQSGTVREFMNNRLVCTNSTNSVQKAAQLMAEHQLNCLVITEEQEKLNNISNSAWEVDFFPPLSIPVGVITERKILQAWSLGVDLSQIPVSSVMRRLGNELSPENSLLYAYQQMQADRMETLLVSERQGESTIVRLGTITEMELLRSLEPVQIYKRLKRTQLSVCQLQTEKAELLRQRNAELEKQVQQRTAQLEAALAAVERQAKQSALIDRIAQAMRGTFVLDDIMQIAANELHQVLNVSRCLVFRPDSEARLGIRYVSQGTLEGNDLIGIECGFYQKYHSQLVRGESLVFPRIAADEPPEILLAVKNCNIRALAIVPLIYQQSYLGGISLNECTGEREWTSEEVAFVKAIADHCAIAIHQAELYQQVRTELQERQKAEVALRESKELFQQLAENIQQVFFVRDTLADELVYVSPAFEKIWGYSREIFSENSRAFLDAVHPDDRDRIMAAVKWEVLSDPYDHEYRIIRPDGEIRWVRDRGFPLKNERGEVYRITGIVDDITEPKQAQTALQEQQQFLRTVIDTNPNLIFVKDWDGKFTLVNQALANVYGTSVHELIGKTDADFNPNLVEVEQFLKADREVIIGLQSRLIIEETVTSPNGTSRYYQTIKTSMLSADGIARQVLGVATDITQRKQAENALQQSQQMLQRIMDNIPQYIFWKETNSVYLGCNRNFARAAGLDNPEQIIGKTDYELPWKKEEADWYRECDRRVMDTNTPEYHILETQLQANGKQTWVDTNKVPLHNADGNVIGILGTYEDITERKQAEEALRESQAILSGIFNNTYQYTALLALDGTLLQANQTALDFGGIQAADAIGRSFWKTKWWKLSKGTQKRLKKAIETAARGEFVRYEVEIVGAGDRIITIDFSLKPILNEAGQPMQLVAEGRDITARKQAEIALEKLNEELEIKVQERTRELQQIVDELAAEISERQQAENALQQNQEKLQAILDNSPAVIYVNDIENRYLLINHQYENLFKLTKEQVIGQSIYDYWPLEIADTFAINNSQVIAEGTAIKVEEVVPHEDGLHTYITVKFPLKDRNGKAYAVCGISMDITERKRAEEALKESEARFQKLAANMPGMIYQYVLRSDGSQALTYVSPSCRQIWEVEPEEMLSDIQQAFSIIHPDDLHSIIENTQASARSLEAWQWEGRIITPSGRLKWIQGISRPEKQPNGDIVWDGLFIDISDRKQAEEALQNSELRLRIALDAAQMGTWDWNIKTDRVMWSERTESIFGFAPGSFPGTQEAFVNCIHPEECPAFGQQIELAIEHKTPHNCETRIVWPDGSIHWIACIGNVMCDVAGNPEQMTGVVMDITDRKLAEEALRNNEWRLRMALTTTQMGTWDWYMETNEIFWSEQTEVIFGFTPGSFPRTYQAYFDRIHPDDRDYLTATIAQSLKEKTPYSVEHRVLWPDGSIVWVAGKGDVICNQGGEAMGIRGVVMDISERKQAEVALRDSEFKLRTIIENTNDVIFLKDPNGNYIFINSAGAKLLNRSVEEVLGKRDEDVFGLETGQRIRATDQKVMASGIKWTYEESINFDGIERFFLITKCPYVSPEDELLGAIGICRDITQAKQAEQTMLRQLAAVEAASDGIAIVNGVGEYIYLNDSHIKIFGYDSADELIGKTWHEFYYQDEAKRIEKDIFPIVIKQGKWQGEATGRRRDGSTFAQELSLTLVADGGLVCVCRDISERKSIEERLRLRERAIAASNNGIIISDARQMDNHIIYVNPAFESMTGYAAAEVLGKNCRFLQGGDKHQPGLEKLRTALKEGKGCTVVVRNYRKDGSLFWNELTVSPIYDSAGILTHYIGIQTDISERKQAEDNLRATTSRLSALIENLQLGVLVKNEFEQVVLINQAFCDMFDIPVVPAALIGADFSNFAEEYKLNFRDSEKFIRQYRQALSDRQLVTNKEAEMVDGRILEQDYVPIIVKGNYSGYLWMYRDITERKQSECELKSSLKEKEILLKEIHHRVKNNLQVISSLLKLQSACIKDEETLGLFMDSYNRVRSMALIHEKLYQSEGLARINADDYIRELAENLLNSYTISQKLIRLKVECDAIQLDIDTAIPCGLIINEIVTNSLKYGFVGKETGEIQVKLLQLPQNYLCLEISDNGVGLPPDFDIEELESLGLQLIYNLTEQLGGEIQVNSVGGTCFSITFENPIRNEE